WTFSFLLNAEKAATFMAEKPPDRKSFGRFETKLINSTFRGCTDRQVRLRTDQGRKQTLPPVGLHRLLDDPQRQGAEPRMPTAFPHLRFSRSGRVPGQRRTREEQYRLQSLVTPPPALRLRPCRDPLPGTGTGEYRSPTSIAQYLCARPESGWP